jgi:hypothetical protein
LEAQYKVRNKHLLSVEVIRNNLAHQRVGVRNYQILPDWAFLNSGFQFKCKAGAFANPDTLAFVVCRNSSLSLSNDN